MLFAPHHNEFLIVWGDSFSVSVSNNIVVRIDHQKQQAILALDSLAHDSIQI